MKLPMLIKRRRTMMPLALFCWIGCCARWSLAAPPPPTEVEAAALREFPYGQVQLQPGLPLAQFTTCIDVLMHISDDSMLKPYRQRAGIPAPGKDIGGWYDNYEKFNWRSNDGRGFAPGHCFGQWLSALARAYAITGNPVFENRVHGLVHSYAAAISPKFYADFRFPAY